MIYGWRPALRAWLTNGHTKGLRMPGLHKIAPWDVLNNILRQGHCAADNILAGIIQVNQTGVKRHGAFFLVLARLF